MSLPITSLTVKDLIDFEEDIANEFNNGNIKAPVHLYSNNEYEMIKIFQDIERDDWIFCTWRSHLQCLLKGVHKDRLKKDILEGKSISLCYPEYNIFSSGIVTGSIPIAVGAALALKIKRKTGKVYVFVGDMGSETGSFAECLRYSIRHDLPIKFIIEDNNKSVCSDTRKTWNTSELTWERINSDFVYYYHYSSKWPHSGANKRVQF